jgi:SAM-dependent methyltransferase
LLDIGCGKGDVIRNFLSYRPDLEIYGIDIIYQKKFLPTIVHFSLADIVKEKLDFPDNFFDGVSVIHVIEHLDELSNLFSEVCRILKHGGAFYIETPSEKTIRLPKFTGWFPDKTGGPINFYDDDSHIKPWPPAIIRANVSGFPFSNIKIGTYRNLLYMLLSPLLLLSGLIFRNRRMFVVGLNHFIGWSIFFRGRKMNR